MQMRDMNNPLPATKGTHISLLAGPHSQGGSVYNLVSETHFFVTFPIAFRDAYYTCFGTPSGKTTISINRISASQMRVDKEANTSVAVTWIAAGS